MIKVVPKAFIVSVLLAFGPATLQAADRPNIVIILTDDMGFSDLGCFGGEIETPNLDALAANGLRFSEFYNTARCWPTRATLMSGCYATRLRRNHVTIPQVLKTAGYSTAMVGKWHLEKAPEGPNSPIQRGFDEFYGTMNGGGSYYAPDSLTRNTTSIEADGENYYYTDKIGEEAVLQIEGLAQAGKLFFQYIAFTAAHWPLHAPEKTIQKYIKRYEGGREQLRKDI
jgi:arylsulfatase